MALAYIALRVRLPRRSVPPRKVPHEYYLPNGASNGPNTEPGVFVWWKLATKPLEGMICTVSPVWAVHGDQILGAPRVETAVNPVGLHIQGF